MMFICGIALSIIGIGGFINVYLQFQKAANSAFYYINADSLTKVCIIYGLFLSVGICMFVFGLYKSRNKKSFDMMMNKQNDILKHYKCPKCGLNLSEGTGKCPKCGEIIQ